MEEQEKIIQITFCDDWFVVLTNQGNLFKRYTLDDRPESFWEKVELPDFAVEVTTRESEPLKDNKNIRK